MSRRAKLLGAGAQDSHEKWSPTAPSGVPRPVSLPLSAGGVHWVQKASEAAPKGSERPP